MRVGNIVGPKSNFFIETTGSIIAFWYNSFSVANSSLEVRRSECLNKKIPIQPNSAPALFQVTSFSFSLKEDSSLKKLAGTLDASFPLFLHYYCTDC